MYPRGWRPHDNVDDGWNQLRGPSLGYCDGTEAGEDWESQEPKLKQCFGKNDDRLASQRDLQEIQQKEEEDLRSFAEGTLEVAASACHSLGGGMVQRMAAAAFLQVYLLLLQRGRPRCRPQWSQYHSRRGGKELKRQRKGASGEDKNCSSHQGQKDLRPMH